MHLLKLQKTKQIKKTFVKYMNEYMDGCHKLITGLSLSLFLRIDFREKNVKVRRKVLMQQEMTTNWQF